LEKYEREEAEKREERRLLADELEEEKRRESREGGELEERTEESDVELEDMESHLNPNAAEFVPISNTPPAVPERMTQMSSDLIAGSPLKQFQHALKNCKIPSEREFQEEVCRRPSEIEDEISDYSNGEPSPQKNDLLESLEDEERPILGSNRQLDLDESEVSSTKAEYNDSVMSELYKTGVSTIDGSSADLDREDLDFSRDVMVTSMTPGDFKSVFEQEPDLNKVHELNDDDLLSDMQNGTILERRRRRRRRRRRSSPRRRST
jgi:protein phosphatase 1E